MKARLSLHAWVTERKDNCLRIAVSKSGGDQGGRLEDAQYFAEIETRLVAADEAYRCPGGWREAVVELEDWCHEPVRLKNMLAAADQIDRFTTAYRLITQKGGAT